MFLFLDFYFICFNVFLFLRMYTPAFPCRRSKCHFLFAARNWKWLSKSSMGQAEIQIMALCNPEESPPQWLLEWLCFCVKPEQVPVGGPRLWPCTWAHSPSVGQDPTVWETAPRGYSKSEYYSVNPSKASINSSFPQNKINIFLLSKYFFFFFCCKISHMSRSANNIGIVVSTLIWPDPAWC